MKDCEKVRDDLKAYLDGQLGPVQRLAVRLHLARCASCRKEIRAMEQIGNDLRAGDEGVLEPALRARILASIPEGAPEAPAGPAPRPKWRQRPMMIWATAATAVIAWFVFYPVVTGTYAMHKADASSPLMREAQNSGSEAPAKMVGGRRLPMSAGNAVTGAGGSGGAFSDSTGVPAAGGAGRNTTDTVIPATPPIVNGPMGGFRSDQSDRDLYSEKAASPSAGSMADSHVAAPTMFEKAAHKGLERTRLPAGYTRHVLAEKDANGAALLPMERKVHKEADITVEVDRIEGKSEQVEQMVNSAGGYVANNELTTGDDNLKSAALTVKVPVDKFDSILGRLAKLGEVKAKHVTGEDLTEKVSDQEQTTRVLHDDLLETRQRLQKRYNRETLHTLNELKIRAAQEQARLEMLKKLSVLADITVQLQEKSKAQPAPQSVGFMGEMSGTAQEAIHSFLQAAKLPVLLLIWLLAYSPVLIVLAIAYRFAFRA